MRLLFSILIIVLSVSYSFAEIKRPSTTKEVFFQGTNHELEVYKINGRYDGPTMLIVGGIQGDEPGGFLSADSYIDITLEKGNLIIIPRANFYSILLFNREVDGVDMNRLFDIAPDDWQGDIVKKIKEYMQQSDIFLNLHDGWGYHYPEHISWHKSPDRFGYSVIVDEEEYQCNNGKILKLGEIAKKAMDNANAKIPEDDPKKHYFNTNTSESSKYKSMRKSATWYAVSDLCIPAFGIEGSKNMQLDKNILYHNYVVNEFMKNAGIEIEYPNIYIDTPLFEGAVIYANDKELFVRNNKSIEIEKNSIIKITEIFSNHKRGVTCDIIDFGNLNDINKDYKVLKDSKIIFRKDNTIIGSVFIKAISQTNNIVTQQTNTDNIEQNNINIQENTIANNQQTTNSKTNIKKNVKYFHLKVDNEDVYIKNGDKIYIKNGSSVIFVKLFSSEVADYNIPINFKGWFATNSSANVGDDRNYKIVFPPANLLIKYSLKNNNKIYPVVAQDMRKKQTLATMYLELE